jgi:hypothetical protein
VVELLVRREDPDATFRVAAAVRVGEDELTVLLVETVRTVDPVNVALLVKRRVPTSTVVAPL